MSERLLTSPLRCQAGTNAEVSNTIINMKALCGSTPSSSLTATESSSCLEIPMVQSQPLDHADGFMLKTGKSPSPGDPGSQTNKHLVTSLTMTPSLSQPSTVSVTWLPNGRERTSPSSSQTSSTTKKSSDRPSLSFEQS